jgi:heme-degrading monooxygenase HmoA
MKEGDDMYARVTRTKSAPETVDEQTDWVDQNILARARSQPGFVGLLDLFDRETGDGLTVTLWETKEARDQSEGIAASMRGEAESAFRAEITGVERYEVTTNAL